MDEPQQIPAPVMNTTPVTPSPAPTPAPAPFAPSVSPAPVVVSTPPEGSNTGKVIGIIIAVVIIAAAIYYFVDRTSGDVALVSPSPSVSVLPSDTPTPSPAATIDPTAGWQTYTNAQYGFELKYPSTWSYSVDTGTATAPGYRLSLVPPNPLSTQSVDEDLSILIREGIRDNLTLETARSQSKPSSYTETVTSFAGQTAYSYTASTSNAQIENNNLLLVRGDAFYNFALHGIRQEVISQLNQIISTFRFTK